MSNNSTIWVTAIEEEDIEYRSDEGRSTRMVQIGIGQLGENIQVLISELSKNLVVSQESKSGFELAELELSAEITTSGKLSILGVSGETGVKGGIKLVFKRK